MQANETDLDLATNDLGPLAWVLDELRKSLEAASSALRRFVRDAAMARGQDMASVDAGQLRIARQQLHQAVGALEMVGLAPPAHMLRSMESAVQKFVERPELCTEQAAAKVERAGFALTEYLEALLLGKPVSGVSLFPQYKDVQELGGADRVHPADLWAFDWRWVEPQGVAPVQTLVYDPAVRSRMDQAVLRIVKAADPHAGRELADASMQLAASQTARQPRIFWKIAAGYFEALAQGLLPGDIYVKRCASRVLLQYASLAKGELGVSDRLAQDLVFFCAQAVPPQSGRAPALDAVREAYGLARFKPVDYATAQFGRFDPVLLGHARKRIGAVKETWSALSGGDTHKLKGVADQFHLVSDSLTKLYPPSAQLAQAMVTAIDGLVKNAKAPSPELAMEVATSVLYLEAALHDLDPSDSNLAERTQRLALRLQHVTQGGAAEPLESWMEDLYRSVSDRQTMGSVVGELRGTLGELEKLLDQFFRNPADKSPLRDAPSHLAQMRGVLSVLGLDMASQAVSRMRETVEKIIVTEIDEQKARAAGTFDKLGNNLGALGFLIDMLNYQPSLAKKLFVYDDTTGELKPLMGRSVPAPVAEPEPEEAPVDVATLQTQVLPAVQAAPAEVPAPAPAVAVAAPAPVVPPPAAPAPAAVAEIDPEEEELRDIFLEEAREVVQNGTAAIQALAVNPADISELTTLRRAFHTLKGSSRMVGLTEFGEAAWSLEQVLNTWLADQKHANDDLRTLSTQALEGFGRWVEDIAKRTDAAWKAGMFRGPADALRTEQRLVPFNLPAEGGAAPAEPPVAAVEDIGFDLDVAAEVIEPAPPMPEPVPEPVAELNIEFDSVDIAAAPVAEPASAPVEPAASIDIDEIVFEMPPEPELEAAPAPAPAEPLPAVEVDFSDPLFDTTTVLRSPVPPAPELPLADVLPEFDLDSPAVAPEAVAAEPPMEIAGIDFDSLSAVSSAAAEPQAPEMPAELAGIELSFDEPEPLPVPEAEPVAEPQAQAETEPERIRDEQVKVIGTLRIGIPLYNVYLNEADEWSRRLSQEISEWTLEMNQRVPDSTVGWAHALAGSSATVGFQALSEVARALEGALEHTQGLTHGTQEHSQVFSGAAEEIRRLLHQFAAGFLKEPDPRVLEGLQALKDLDIPFREEESLPEDDLGLSGFGDLDFSRSSPPPAAPPVQSVSLPVAAAEPEPEPEPQPVMEFQPEPVIELEPEPVVAFTPEPEPAPLIEPVIELEPAPVFVEPIAVEPAFVEPVAVAPQVPVAPVAPVASATMAPVQPHDEHAGEDDLLDVVDAVDPDLFPIFEEEAQELMPQLGSALRSWASRPDDAGARDQCLRALHTLKGSARLAGALRLGEMAHRLESAIQDLGSEDVNPADIEHLLQTFDAMQARFDTLRAADAAVDQQQLAAALGQHQDPVAEAAPLAPVADIVVPVAAEATRARSAIAMPASMQMTSARQAANQTVRVRSQLMDRLVNQAGEVMITRTRLEAELKQLRQSLTDLTGNLDRLRAQLREIELQAETQMQSRMAQSKETGAGFDPLEFDRFTRVQELTRFMAESVNDIATVQRNIQRVVESTEDDLIAQARQTRELQRDLLRTRMVEFEGISDRLYRVVRLAAKESDKQVKLDIVGGSIEMDRGVLDRMTPAFEHLLRNCVAHGIESPQVRTAAAKNPVGHVQITLRQEGNDVSVEFTDDGAGLNLQRIRDKAMQQGLIGIGHELTAAEAANLIFLPGFSTASLVTELAGRGIGMDVVRSEVNALGGRIETTTETGRGSSFRLVLPLTTAVTQVVMIRSGRLAVGVPANLVELVRRAPLADVQQAYATGEFEFAGEKLPFFWSGALLQASTRSAEPQGKTLPVVIFRSAAQRVAVHVDEVLGNQEVVVKNLGPQLSRLPGLAGMTVLASGAVVLIYNPVALTQVYGDQARALAALERAAPAAPGLEQTAAVAAAAVVAAAAEGSQAPTMPTLVQAPPTVPLVLVVDDSITVRRVTQRLLQREGYRVSMAADGLQALERLAEELPAVVLSDIEMPRMDGFDLARNIRNDARLRGLPIVMITSRIAEKHREHAKELGVNHYLGKPYSEEELLSLVKHYSFQAVSA